MNSIVRTAARAWSPFETQSMSLISWPGNAGKDHSVQTPLFEFDGTYSTECGYNPLPSLPPPLVLLTVEGSVHIPGISSESIVLTSRPLITSGLASWHYDKRFKTRVPWVNHWLSTLWVENLMGELCLQHSRGSGLRSKEDCGLDPCT
jgi:hypothetical protein